MSRSPEDIRREIEQARGALGSTLEAIGDRVSPKLAKERAKEKVTERMDQIGDRVSPRRMVRRRAARVRVSMRNVRESVMGTVEEVDPGGAADSVREGAQRASRRVGEAAGSLADEARAAPELARAQAQGNPLVAGLVAFGGGMILASALPPTESERQAAERILEGLEPLKEQAVSAGRSVAGELQQSAQARAEQVRRRATAGAERVRSEAQSSAEEAKGRARGASKRVRKRAEGATKQVSKQAQGATKQVRKQARKKAQGATKQARKQTRRPVRAPSKAGARRSPRSS